MKSAVKAAEEIAVLFDKIYGDTKVVRELMPDSGGGDFLLSAIDMDILLEILEKTAANCRKGVAILAETNLWSSDKREHII